MLPKNRCKSIPREAQIAQSRWKFSLLGYIHLPNTCKYCDNMYLQIFDKVTTPLDQSIRALTFLGPLLKCSNPNP